MRNRLIAVGAGALLCVGALTIIAFYLRGDSAPQRSTQTRTRSLGDGELSATMEPPALARSGPQMPGSRQVEGRVLSARDGRPVSGALVVQTPQNDALVPIADDVVRSREDGSFSVRITTPEAHLYCWAPGFIPESTPLDQRTEIVIRLAVGEVVAGRVLNARGEPIPDAHVAVTGRGAAGRLRSRSAWAARSVAAANTGTAVTGPEGQFTITGLHPGPVRVRASKTGWYTVRAPDRVDRHRDAALPVATPADVLTSAGDRNVDIRMARATTIAVEPIDAETGASLQHARVTTLVRPDSPAMMAVNTEGWPLPEARGSYGKRKVFRVFYAQDTSAENVALKVTALGYEPRRVSLEPRHVTDASDLTPVAVRLTANESKKSQVAFRVRFGKRLIKRPLVARFKRVGSRGVTYIIVRADDRGHRTVALPSGTYVWSLAGTPELMWRPPAWRTLELDGQEKAILGDLQWRGGIVVLDISDRQTSAPLDGCAVRVTSNDRRGDSQVLKKPHIESFRRPSFSKEVGADPPGKYWMVLAPGTYRLNINAFGYEPAFVQRIEVAQGTAQAVDIELGRSSR